VATYRPFYPAFSDDILHRCMDEFHLPLDARLNQLSMGDKKKALMSFALATNVRYLLMDEPTNGLDLPSKKQFRKVIATTMTEERTLIIATHQLHDVEALLDHVLILQGSKLLLNASVADLCEQYTFDVRSNDALTDDVLYSERTPQGNATLSFRQPDDEETPLNLELLFNAAHKISLTANSPD
jgi:ABC-2 type transport system ATP-binding protein